MPDQKFRSMPGNSVRIKYILQIFKQTPNKVNNQITGKIQIILKSHEKGINPTSRYNND